MYSMVFEEMSTICIGCVAAASSKILECSRVMTGARQYRRETREEREKERERESSNEAKHVWHVSAAVGGQTPFLPSATTAIASSFMESWSAAPQCTVPSMEQSRSEIGVGRLPSCTAGVRMDSHVRPSILYRGPRRPVCLKEESLGNVCECM